MDMSFQFVVDTESPVQLVWQVCPALKTSPGPGSLGVTSALTKRGAATARRAEKTRAENIFFFFNETRQHRLLKFRLKKDRRLTRKEEVDYGIQGRVVIEKRVRVATSSVFELKRKW